MGHGGVVLKNGEKEEQHHFQGLIRTVTYTLCRISPIVKKKQQTGKHKNRRQRKKTLFRGENRQKQTVFSFIIELRARRERHRFSGERVRRLPFPVPPPLKKAVRRRRRAIRMYEHDIFEKKGDGRRS